MTRIDVHAHLAPRLDHVRWPLSFVDSRRGNLPEKLFRPDLLVAWLDAEGIDGALVSVPPPFFIGVSEPGRTGERTQALNEGLADAIGRFEDRLRPLAYLPTHDPQVAAGEAERCSNRLWAGFVVPAGGKLGADLAGTELMPLWQSLDQQRAFVLIHPSASADPRLDAFYLHNLLGNPLETALAAAQLTFGDILGRFDKIKFCLAHAGGCTPSVVGRWQRGYDTQRPGITSLIYPPADAVRRLWADCLAHDPDALRLAVEVFGENHILLGSDWPFPMGHPHPLELLGELPAATAQRIMSDNARGAIAAQN